MPKQRRASHPLYNLLPTEIEGFDSLAELTLDMRSSWNHAIDEVWQELDLIRWHPTPLTLFSLVLSALKRNGASRPVFNSNQITGLLAQFRFNKVHGVGWHQ